MNEHEKNHALSKTEGLAPQQPAAAEVPDWAVMPTGAPAEFGVDSRLPANGNPSTKNYAVEKKRVWQRQEAFLKAYRECGKIGKAAQAVGLTRWAVDWWNKRDVFQFRERINAAHLDYVEKWEEHMDDRLENPIKGVQGSDVLLMSKLRAERPEKYREAHRDAARDQHVAITRVTVVLDKGVDPAGERQIVETTYRELPPAAEGEYQDLNQG